jgi:CspA family cold shock protein
VRRSAAPTPDVRRGQQGRRYRTQKYLRRRNEKHGDNSRALGTVQWFSRIKGYGFIRPDDQEEDVFVHYSAIRGEGYRNLNEGQRVEFVMEDTPKGPQAVDVIGLDSAELDVAELDVAELDVAELDVAELDVAELDVAESEPAEPFI